MCSTWKYHSFLLNKRKILVIVTKEETLLNDYSNIQTAVHTWPHFCLQRSKTTPWSRRSFTLSSGRKGRGSAVARWKNRLRAARSTTCLETVRDTNSCATTQLLPCIIDPFKVVLWRLSLLVVEVFRIFTSVIKKQYHSVIILHNTVKILFTFTWRFLF